MYFISTRLCLSSITTQYWLSYVLDTVSMIYGGLKATKYGSALLTIKCVA